MFEDLVLAVREGKRRLLDHRGEAVRRNRRSRRRSGLDPSKYSHPRNAKRNDRYTSKHKHSHGCASEHNQGRGVSFLYRGAPARSSTCVMFEEFVLAFREAERRLLDGRGEAIRRRSALDPSEHSHCRSVKRNHGYTSKRRHNQDFLNRGAPAGSSTCVMLEEFVLAFREAKRRLLDSRGEAVRRRSALDPSERSYRSSAERNYGYTSKHKHNHGRSASCRCRDAPGGSSTGVMFEEFSLAFREAKRRLLVGRGEAGWRNRRSRRCSGHDASKRNHNSVSHSCAKHDRASCGRAERDGSLDRGSATGASGGFLLERLVLAVRETRQRLSERRRQKKFWAKVRSRF